MKSKIICYEKSSWITNGKTELYEYLLWEKGGTYLFNGWINRKEKDGRCFTCRDLCYKKENLIHFLRYCAATQTSPEDVEDLMFENLVGSAFSEPAFPDLE